MRKQLLIATLAVAAIAAPAAFAHGGPGKGKGGGGGPTMSTYELKGTLSAYTAAVGATPGSITIAVTRSNKAGRPFVGLTLTFSVGATTKVEAPVAGIVDGDPGSVQVKGAPGLDATGLQALVPKQIEDDAGESADG